VEGAGCGACVDGSGAGGGLFGAVVIALAGVLGGDGDGLDELSAGLGVSDAEAVTVAVGLDELSAGIVAPLVLAQAAVRTSRAMNPPTYPPRPRLAFCFPAAAGISGSERCSGAVGMVTVGHGIATFSRRAGNSSNCSF
jgi:hypothetical protein